MSCWSIASGCGVFGKRRWFDERYWILAKQAVALDALPLLARHTAAVIAGDLGLPKKCLVLDLDNTLWGGVVGEDGVPGLQLGGTPRGEAFLASRNRSRAQAARRHPRRLLEEQRGDAT